nr:glycosyltransferase family A protein [Sphingomonas telluris]
MGRVSRDLVSVIVPAWNAEATLGATLESVAAQTHTELEIIIVDDGSEDGTAQIAERFTNRDPRARLIRQRNGGVASARNIAIAHARGTWIAPIDADDLWHPTKIAKQLDAVQSAPVTSGFVYCWHRSLDADGNIVGSSARWPISGSVMMRLSYLNFVGNGSSPLFLRDAVVAAGGYSEALRANRAQGCEDLLLQLRIARQYPVLIVPEHLVGYRVRTGSMSRDVGQMVRSLDFTHQLVAQDGEHAPPAVQRRAQAILYMWLGQSAAAAGHWGTAIQALVRGALIDPARGAVFGGYALSRVVAFALRGGRRSDAGPPFLVVEPAEDLSSRLSIPLLVDRFDHHRLQQLKRSELPL